MTNLKVVLLTGNKLRHRYWAGKLLNCIPQSYLVIEEQPIDSWGAHTKFPTPLIRQHFNDFKNTEKKYFEKYVKENSELIRSRLLCQVKEGDINKFETIQKIKRINPVIILVLSTSLLSDQFISAFPNKIINFHAGLSPHYRGSGTNVFPFYNHELEYVGVTIHYLDIGIDSGDIIVQGRPVFDNFDNTHSIGCKNIDVGINLMAKIVTNYPKYGFPVGHKQDLSIGKLYYKKHFTDEVIKKIRQNINQGIVKEYVKIQPTPVKIIEKIVYE